MMAITHPKPEQIKARRQQAGITQAAAAELVYITKAGWQHFEYGRRVMPRSTWELFQIKTKGLTAK